MNIPDQNTTSLRDIHLPDAISWWPPAIGWWLLLLLIIIALFYIPKLYRRLTFTPLQKVANMTFQNIVNQYKEKHDKASFIAATSRFLRQTAMSYCGREDVAQLTGEKWVQALNNLTEQNYFTDDLKQSLINAPYQKKSNINVEQLIETVQNWLAGLPEKPGDQKK